MSRNSRSGMTLLETLVSLAVMAVVALMLAQGMGAMLRFSARSNASADEVEAMTARLQLRRIVEWAANSPFPDHDYVGFQGDNHGVTIETWYPEAPFWAGAPVVVEVSADEKGVVHAKASGLDLQKKPLTVDQVIMPSGGLVLRYFGQRKNGRVREWSAAWSVDDGLPELLELSSAEPVLHFPPLVLRPARQLHLKEMSLDDILPAQLP